MCPFRVSFTASKVAIKVRARPAAVKLWRVGRCSRQHGAGTGRAHRRDGPPDSARLRPSLQRARLRGTSICLSASGSAAKPIGRAKRQGRTCSITSRCSKIPSASTSGTGCCHPSSSNDSTRYSPKPSRKLGAIHLASYKDTSQEDRAGLSEPGIASSGITEGPL